MTADPQLRDRLERAARFVEVDTDTQLGRVRDAAGRRGRDRRVRALLVAAAIGALALIPIWALRPADRGVTPAGFVSSGRIAVLGLEADRGALFTLDVASGSSEEIPHGSGSVLWADWSPDGSRLAYIVEEPGPRYAVVVTEPDGSQAVTILEEDATGAVGPDMLDLSWSPDGSRIAVAGRTVEAGVARRTILVVNADGSGRPDVLDGLWVEVAWSPDGSRLLGLGFPPAGSDAAQFDLYTMRPDGSGLVQLTDDAAAEHQASWSPDGTQIVYAWGDGYAQGIYVMAEDGSEVRRLTDWKGLDGAPTWSPDGAWIAFASDRAATAAQQARNRDGEHRLTGFSIDVIRVDGSGLATLPYRGLPVSWTGG